MWRQGRKILQNVYDGDKPVAQFHDEGTAFFVVKRVNEYEAMKDRIADLEATIKSLRSMLRKLGDV